MRVRLLAGAAAVLVAGATLAGCESNVGVAATIDGQRVTESQLSSYVTPDAQGITLSQGASKTPPKSFVLFILAQNALYRAVFAKTPNGVPSDGTVSNAITSELKGRSASQVVDSTGVKGYSDSFDHEILLYFAYQSLLQNEKVNATSIVKTLDFPVSINPRYGTWNAKHYSIDAGAGAGRPTFLTLQP